MTDTRRAGAKHDVPGPRTICYLAAFGYMVDGSPVPKCQGRFAKAHLIPQNLLKRCEPIRNGEISVWDRRFWRFACGGWNGSGGHHGLMDQVRTLKLPRSAIPEELDELAEYLGLGYWLDREYGERHAESAA